jgi:hypothetical protein
VTLDQSIVWTALPNGWVSPGTKLALSVFAAPRLESSAHPPLLTPFDFANWPDTLAHQRGGALRFTVTFEGHAPVVAQLTSPAPDSTKWSYIFKPGETRVDPWKFKDLSGAPLQSFSVTGVESFVQKFYTAVGAANPLSFPPVSLLSKYLPSEDTNRRGAPGWGHVTDAVKFHQLPHSLPADTVQDPRHRIPVPTFDFHATLSALHSYPALMRQLGLVFDLEVTVPAGLSATPKVKVTPKWHPNPRVHGTIDVSPWTACRLSAASFRAAPRGLDYDNGMLNLHDAARFAVVELDTDGAADRLSALATSMLQTNPPRDSTAHGTPALRSAGLTVTWSGWAEQPSKGAGRDLTDLITSQKANNAVIESYVASHGVGPLPTFHAEDLIRGHRFDVLTTSEAAPAWRSLCFRAGTYRLGKPEHVITIDDEGAVSSALSQPSGLVKYNSHTGAFGASVPPPPDLYAHERIARWKGWSLVAERPGKSGVGPGTQLQEGGKNPVPPTEPGAVGSPPLLSVTVAAPTSGDHLLPKLRFGDFYRFRARAADLAGNGVEAASADVSTATAPKPHLRFEPVESPQLAAIRPPAPGEGTQLMVILDDLVNPVPPNGRWVFPPKVSELMAEEHGMLDGFVEGAAPDPSKPPSAAPATFEFLAARDPARLNDLPGVEFYGANFNSTGSPNVGTPYFPGATKLAVPWIPDPLSSGVAMVGVPGTTGPVVRLWEGGRWPDPDPLLLVLQAGAVPGEAYVPGTATDSAVETIILPPGETAEVAMSSALFAGAVGPLGRLLGLLVLGPWQWLADSGINPKLLDELRAKAAEGLLWQLSPSRVLTLVHAVRLPLLAPTFGLPATRRQLGSTKAELLDLSFVVDVKSTSSLDFLATWIDPVDDIAKPAPDLSAHSANAFKLTVDEGFKLDGGNSAATQDFGDTKHHLVDYHAVGTSRFNGYFRQTTTVTFSGATPVVMSTFGLDAASVSLSIPSTSPDKPAKEFPRGDFRVDAPAGTVALTASGVAAAAGEAVDVSWIPTDTLAGPKSLVPVLSTARPLAPTIARVVPAWALSAPRGSLDSDGITQTRQGNFLRVYLDRPWFSSGGGELLGVVTRLDAQLPTAAQQAHTSVVGADPIYDALFSDWGSFTGISSFLNQAIVPSVPGRPDYTSPPELSIVEDPSGAKYRIWPFEVRFDTHTRLWYADIGLAFDNPDGAYPPMFARLALARFQPWSLAGVEVSAVALASIAQPVPDRSVLVTTGSTLGTVQVQVSGWGYAGWRPAVFKTAGDAYSGISPTQDAPETYGGPTMVVEVQSQSITLGGLGGDFAWAPAPGTRPVMLPSPGDNGAFVSWSGEVPLPKGTVTDVGRLRLRISEIDFYTGSTAPAVVDTNYRRPFVVHIPLS